MYITAGSDKNIGKSEDFSDEEVIKENIDDTIPLFVDDDIELTDYPYNKLVSLEVIKNRIRGKVNKNGEIFTVYVDITPEVTARLAHYYRIIVRERENQIRALKQRLDDFENGASLRYERKMTQERLEKKKEMDDLYDAYKSDMNYMLRSAQQLVTTMSDMQERCRKVGELS